MIEVDNSYAVNYCSDVDGVDDLDTTIDKKEQGILQSSSQEPGAEGLRQETVLYLTVGGAVRMSDSEVVDHYIKLLRLCSSLILDHLIIERISVHTRTFLSTLAKLDLRVFRVGSFDREKRRNRVLQRRRISSIS